MCCSWKLVKLGALLAYAALCGGVAMADSTQVRVASRKDGPTGKVQATVRAAKQPPSVTGKSEPDRGEPKVHLVIERYPNRQIKIKKQVIHDENGNLVNHGDWTMWDPHGNVIAAGQFQHGKRQGNWSRLQSQATAHFHSSLYHGFRKPFVWETSFKDDVLHGDWKIVDADGRPIRHWRFDQGRLDGEAIVWWPEGQKRHEITYRQGIPHGEVSEWDPAGRLTGKINFVDGRRKRPFVERYPQGHVAVEGWVRGAREVAQTRFNWWDGSVLTELLASQEKEVREGAWTYYHPNGRRQYVGRFEEDTPLGTHIWWYANGHKRMEGAFIDGKEEGRWTWWHANGQELQSGLYMAGRRAEEWVTWSTAGQVVDRRNYSAPSQQTPEHVTPQDAVVNSSKKTTSRKTVGREANPSPRRVARSPRGPLSRQRQEALPEILKKWRSGRGTRLR